jgi:hypothetical protein
MFNHSHRMRAHYTHAFSVIFLSQAAYVANRRHAFAIARAGNLPAAKWERDHGVLTTVQEKTANRLRAA